ncbi:MAG TPA: asparagine synthase (glutamine-hydrolyzing) [Gammaproteobacteria bacterium]|nr:asparagine synthase (glutamine-hydrolyzing) [Gammaproteobacteria bacterium]
MCGLTGVLSTAGGDVEARRALAGRMAETLRHRGPDAGGVWAEGPVALGHRRLSILDLSPMGAQPMSSASRRFVIAYNGEIYNHPDLRRELAAVGAASSWRGNSDTETLLAGIEYWGLDETLSRVAGMFALALWDRTEGRLSLARDRMGEKPLYWGWAGRDLVFGSELKALRIHPYFPTGVCHTALAQYLSFAYVPAPLSIHPGIFKLEPGCILELSGPLPKQAPVEPPRPGAALSGLSIRRYWSLAGMVEGGARQSFTDEAEATAAVEAALGTAIDRQRIADVQLGAFLSGGIDSSLVVALMQARGTEPVRTFTIGFENLAFDESPHADAVARHLGTRHTALVVTEAETREVIPQLPDLYDEPFADSSQIPTHLVCRAARSEVTVALSGDGGDELFGGYNRHVWGPKIWDRVGRMPAGARTLLGHVLATVPPRAWDRLGRLPGPLRRFSRLGEKMQRLGTQLDGAASREQFYRNIISAWDGTRLVPGTPGSTLLDDPTPAALSHDPAGWMMFQDMRTYLPDDILCKVDRAAMGISLETRAPFLDPGVLVVSARVPEVMKIRDGKGKWILRQILFRHVPPSLIERPKTGFGIPVGDWLRGPLRPWAEDLLSEASLGREGYFEPAPIRRAWADHLSGRRDWTHRLWIILMFMAWRARWG